jgi:membrane fusion protein (multidrug efflux system)
MSELVLERKTAGIPIPKLMPRLKALALPALAVVAGLAAAVYGYQWWTVDRWFESTDDAYVGGNVTSISPHVAGFVSQILIDDNQRVRAGQLLVRLDDRNYAATLDRANAIVLQREAALDSLSARYTLQQSSIRQTEASLAADIAEAAFRTEDAQRYRNLASTNAGSRQNEQKAVAWNRKAQAAVASSRAALDAARQQLTVLKTEIAEAEAAVSEAKADSQTARLNMEYTEIRSPIDGYIGNRAAKVGAYVHEGTYLLSIIPAHHLWVDANFKEDQLTLMKPGQPATVVVDLMPDHVFQGRIVSLAPATGAIFSVIPPENATGNFTKIVQRVPVRVVLDDDASGALRPGLSTTVTIDTRSD